MEIDDFPMKKTFIYSKWIFQWDFPLPRLIQLEGKPMGAIHRLALDMAWISGLSNKAYVHRAFGIQHGCVASSAMTLGIEVFIRSPPKKNSALRKLPKLLRSPLAWK